ncbi:glycosyltransferase family 2 protein [Mucilaginibacter terrae]|uniref:glycosyltransferase family 2 protein n=1 Tax=Mucilaginibacter terrae TaxID=1955052 RepID=UPI00363C6F22
MPEVSVLIPNYNHAVYLRERIDSVLNQTYQDFEVIILDDCSPDNSRDVIEEYRNHPKVSKIVWNETNSGTTFKQWEKGISLAQGKYIWIAESDDWCEVTLLDTLVSALKANGDCVLAYAQSYIVYNDNEINWISRTKFLSEYVNGKVYIKKHLLKRNSVFNASMAIFRKDIYFRFSKEYTKFKFCGDWLFWIEAAKQGDVFVSGRVLNYFRKHGKDVSGKAYTSGFNFIEEVKVIQSLKNDDIITEEEYKEALLYRYYNYQKVVKQVSAEIKEQIDKLFFNNGQTSYKSFLISKYRLHSLKSKSKQLLKFFLS